jgi:hypothetical protein
LRGTEYKNRATHMSRAPLFRSFLSLSRAAPGALADALEEDMRIVNLKGVPCPWEACETSSKEGFISNQKILGKRCVKNERGPHINTASVWHKCDSSGVRQSVGLYNPLYAGFLGRGGHGITHAKLAMWNCVEGTTLSFTVRQLNIGEKYCRAY